MRRAENSGRGVSLRVSCLPVRCVATVATTSCLSVRCIASSLSVASSSITYASRCCLVCVSTYMIYRCTCIQSCMAMPMSMRYAVMDHEQGRPLDTWMMRVMCMRHAKCNDATCNMHATCSCDMRHATYYMQHATCDMLRITSNRI